MTRGPVLAALALGIGALLGFRSIGQAFHRDFALTHGTGMYNLLPDELSFLFLYLVVGGVAWAGLAVALGATTLPDRAVEAGRAMGRRPRGLALAAALLTTLCCVSIAALVLDRQVISDDEHVYRFIARTILTGSLAAPPTGGDDFFFREQFVVSTPTGRYGKYPIGHPLLLAAGQVAGAEWLVVPLVTGVLVAVTTWIALQVAGPGVGALAALLLVASPQVLFTGATWLSQPASALCVALAVAALLRADASERFMVPTLLAGAALAFGVLVRPLPMVLLVGVAAIFVAVEGRRLRPGWWQRLAVLGVPVAAAAGVHLLVNRAQAGSMFTTAYAQSLPQDAAVAGLLATTSAIPAVRVMSVVGTALRLNAWLTGWPLSLLTPALAPLTRPAMLMWGVVAAEVVYRVLTPKVGVGGAGPIYAFEAVPLLCVLSAMGAARVARSGIPVLGSARAVAAAVLAGMAVSVALFVPPRLQDLSRMGAAQKRVFAMLRQGGTGNALVFHEGVVPWWTGLSWAYYPPTNPPGMDGDILFANFARPAVEENARFWQRRFPQRTAWYFGYVSGKPVLVPLDDYVRAGAPAPSP